MALTCAKDQLHGQAHVVIALLNSVLGAILAHLRILPTAALHHMDLSYLSQFPSSQPCKFGSAGPSAESRGKNMLS